MSIGGVMVFDPPARGQPPTVEDVCENLAVRLGRLPRYSRRLSSPRTGGFAWPRWSEDAQFEIRNHVGHIAPPAPGGNAELCEWTADFDPHRLDRMRPLWEMMLIEGLEGGRWALAHKTHHCLVDGVGSVDVAYLLLDAEPAPPERSLPAPAPSADGSLLASLVAKPPQPMMQAAQAGANAARAGVAAALHPGDALYRSRSRRRSFTRRWRARCTRPGYSTSQSRTSPAPRSPCTRLARRCGRSSRWSRWLRHTPSGSRSFPMTAWSRSG